MTIPIQFNLKFELDKKSGQEILKLICWIRSNNNNKNLNIFYQKNL